MQLSCTKSLMKYLPAAIAVGIADPSIAPLYCWSANMFTVNRRRAIAVCNAYSRCGFVLYGITTKYKKDLDELLVNGVRACLESEGIAPGVIERYLNDCGTRIAYSKSINRSLTAHLKFFCDRVKYCAGALSDGMILQRQLIPWLNCDIIKDENGEYEMTYALLGSALQARYEDEKIYSCHAAVLDRCAAKT